MKIIVILDKYEGTHDSSPVPAFTADLVKRLVSDSGITEITIKREAGG